MEQLAFDFVCNYEKAHKTHTHIYTDKPIKNFKKGSRLVFVDWTNGNKATVNSKVTLFATPRKIQKGLGYVISVWEGPFKDIPARFIQYQQNGITTYDELFDATFPSINGFRNEEHANTIVQAVMYQPDIN